LRQAAQFALAGKGGRAVLAKVGREGKDPTSRLHAIWGLGQLGAESDVLPLLKDSDPEVRAQAAKVLGDSRMGSASGDLIALLKDASLRVRFFSAIALGKLARPEAIGPLLEMIRENQDRDVYLRHAAVMGLSGIQDR